MWYWSSYRNSHPFRPVEFLLQNTLPIFRWQSGQFCALFSFVLFDRALEARRNEPCAVENGTQWLAKVSYNIFYVGEANGKPHDGENEPDGRFHKMGRACHMALNPQSNMTPLRADAG
jgi:hypothetical protein